MFYILALNFCQLAYKGTHHLYIPKHEVSFYMREHFLIRLLRFILNRFCSVFQFRLYIRGCPVGWYILFHLILWQNNQAWAEAPEAHEVVNVIGNWSSAISITMPRLKLLPQHIFLCVIWSIDFHRACCGVRYDRWLDTFYHFRCAFSVVAVVNC